MIDVFELVPPVLVGQSKIYFQKFYGKLDDLLLQLLYNTLLTLFLFDLVSPLLMCVTYTCTPDVISLDMTGYTLDYTAGV